ncbi:MAG TPA: hypothetical protein VK737_08720 [Opitutales bacterium]|jgi:hypothetical protein|nr:hypothetical protein [Opitutales bacterium]
MNENNLTASASYVYARCHYCGISEEAEIFNSDIGSANAIVQLKIAHHALVCQKRLSEETKLPKENG